MPRVKKYGSYKKKTHWAKQLILVGIDSSSSQSNTVAANGNAVSIPTPNIVTVGNFRVKGDITLPSSTIGVNSYCFIFIAYVPEGVNVDNNTAIGQWFEKHPEYVMAWKPVPLPAGSEGSGAQSAVFSLSSNLKRRLNSGDTVRLMMYSNTGAIKFNGAVEFYAKAN